MKKFNYLILLIPIALVLFSCGKEDSLEIKDDSSFTPNNTDLKTNTMTLGKATFYNLAGQVLVEDTVYHMVIESQDLVLGTGGLVAVAMQPKPGQTTIENGTYVSVPSYQGLSISQSTIDAYNTWIQNGANPNSKPTIEPEYLQSSNLTFTVSNVVKNTGIDTIPTIDLVTGTITKVLYLTDDALISVNGTLTNDNGTQTPVSALVETKIHRKN